MGSVNENATGELSSPTGIKRLFDIINSTKVTVFRFTYPADYPKCYTARLARRDYLFSALRW